MGEDRICPRCGNLIPPDAPGGICPYCLISQAMELKDESVPSAAGRDANLLFALFAFLLKHVDVEEFSEAIQEWVENPTVSIADRLTEKGILTPASRKYLDDLALNAIRFHGGNVTKTLGTLGGHERVAKLLQGSAYQGARELVETRLDLNVSDDLLAAESAPETTVDEKPGRYTGSSEYSRGGMGRILLVHDELLGRDIALKELLPPSDSYVGPDGEEISPMRASAALLARFLREARVTGRLEHPSIVPVYELGRRPDGALYYTMRLVRGKTLRTVLEECATLEDRLRLLPNFVDLCMGLAYAHSKGVVHRDIKPSNVMIGEFGETVIIDWGLAKVVDGEDIPDDTLHKLHGSESISLDRSATGEVLGSPHYMSPEQAEGDVSQIDARADVFSLGVLLYEILADHVAFEGDSLEVLVDQIRYEEPVPISRREPHVPNELISICERAMRKEKGERYPSARAMADDINRFLAGSVVSSYNYSIFERARRFYRQHRFALNTAALSLAIIVTTVIIAIVRIENSRQDAVAAQRNEAAMRDRAETDRYAAEIRLADSHIQANNPQAANEVLWKVQPEQRGWEWGYLLNRSRPEMLRIDGPGPDSALSPDGSLIAAAVPRGPLRLYSSEDKRIVREFAPTEAVVDEIVFSHDGTKLLVGYFDNRARLWDVQTGLLIHTVGGHFRNIHTVLFTPDDSRFVTVSSDQMIRVWDTSSGEQLAWLRMGRPGLSGAVIDSTGTYLAAWLMDARPPLPREVQLWNLETGEQLWTAQGNRPAFAANGTTVFFARDTLIVEADTQTGEEVRELSAHRSEVSRIALTPDGLRAVSGATDGELIVWNLTDGAVESTTSQRVEVLLLSIDPTARRFATTSRDSRLWVWDVDGATNVAALPGHDHHLMDLQFANDGETILTSSLDLTARLWRASGELGTRQFDDMPAIADLSVATSAGLLAAHSGEELLLVDAATGERVQRIFEPAPVLGRDSGISSDGRIVAVAFDGFTVPVWDRATNRLLSVLMEEDSRIVDLTMDKDGQHVATACWDGTVNLWRTDTGTKLASFEPTGEAITSIGMGSDDLRIVAGDRAGHLVAIDPIAGEVGLPIQAHDAEISAVEIGPTGDRVVSGTRDGEMGVWRWPDLDSIALFRTESGEINDVSFAERGDRLATATTTVVGGVEARVRTTDTWEELIGIDATDKGLLHAVGWYGSSLVLGGKSPPLQILTAAPFSPLENIEDEHERFEAFRREDLSATVQIARGGPVSDLIVVSSDMVFTAMTALAEYMAGDEVSFAPGQGVGLGPSLSRSAQVALRLRESDRLIRMQDEQLDGVSETLERLTALASAIEAGSLETFRIEINSDSDHRLAQYWVVRPRIVQRRLEEARAAMADRLAQLVEALRTRSADYTEYSHKSALELGIDLPEDTLSGWFIPLLDSPTQRQNLLMSGMSTGDRLVEFDGAAVTGILTFADRLEALLGEIQSGQRSEFAFRVQRGPFLEVAIEIALQ